MKKFFELSSWSLSFWRGRAPIESAAIGSMLIMAFAVVGCDDSSSASVGPNDEPGIESSSSSSGKVTEPAEVTSSSSSVDPVSSSSLQGDKNSSSSGENESSSSSVKSESSSSVGDLQSSSSKDPELAEESFTDTRDGKKYKTVTIGDQVWMAENLNYAYTGIPYKNDSYTSDSTSWCYGNDPAYCAKYGRLYTWAAAMDSEGKWSTNGKGCGYNKTCSPTYPVRGVCPEGWHLPSQAEWNALFTAVGGGATAGAKLKSQTGWTAFDGITNEDAFGFSALPAGFRYYDGLYSREGYHAIFWSSTEDGSNYAYHVSLTYRNDNADLSSYYKSYGFSVRCLKD